MRDVTRRRTPHLPAIDRFHTACQRSCSWLPAPLHPSDACRVSESNVYSILRYRVRILTPYRLWLQALLRASDACRVSESNVYSTLWYSIYILTPYRLWLQVSLRPSDV